MSVALQRLEASLKLPRKFPQLRRVRWEVSSVYDPKYNCAAFVFEDEQQNWWPSDPNTSGRDEYWPPDLPREETIENFVIALGRLGYERCEGGALEDGFEKVAIYAKNGREPKHLAKQLATGQWKSKMGQAWDIVHPTLEVIEGNIYGEVVQFLRRPRADVEEIFTR
jgi:hypothetical protein